MAQALRHRQLGHQSFAAEVQFAFELELSRQARRGPVAAGRSIAPNTYNWGTKRLYIDVLEEYYSYKRFAVFANLRNIGHATEDFEIYNPQTLEHAQFRPREDFGALWTFGLKGTF